MSIPVVAVVGRPNVGKSTLFNKLTGKRIAIVENTPGVTRDRIYCETEWRGRKMMLIDTGGIEPRADTAMLKYMRRQAEIAIETADVIVFLTDVTVGMLDEDRQIASLLMKSGKPVVLAVNKIDRIGALPAEYYEFYQLGFKDDPIALSSLHGSGTGDLLDKILSFCPEEEEPEGGLEESIRVAVIGKPNAGKSSLINRILGRDRLIVSEEAGTTRDAIDTAFENEFGSYVFVDTAGIRRQSRIDDPIEKYSVLRAKLAVERADVCLILIDAEQGITEQDERIAGIAHEAGKPSVICINKWDLIEKDNNTVKKFTEKVYAALSYMTYADVVFLSARTGLRVERLFPMINAAYEQSGVRITTGMLNDVLNDATARVQPPSDKGRYLKIYYMTQVGTRPPSFVIFCNSADLFHFSYQRYLENRLRDVFGFRGTPIRLTIRERGEEK